MDELYIRYDIIYIYMNATQYASIYRPMIEFRNLMLIVT